MSEKERPKPGRTLESETEQAGEAEGIRLREISVGGAVEVETQNRTYLIERLPDGFYLSSQPPHLEYCPVPTKAEINGSRFMKDGSSIKQNFIGKGMFMEFSVPGYKQVVTSQIKDVRVAKRVVQ